MNLRLCFGHARFIKVSFPNKLILTSLFFLFLHEAAVINLFTNYHCYDPGKQEWHCDGGSTMTPWGNEHPLQLPDKFAKQSLKILFRLLGQNPLTTVA